MSKLSQSLIESFVKITNDKPAAKNDTIVYGETVYDKDAGKVKVKIDGSDTLIEMESTCDLSLLKREGGDGTGARVIVLIKNHKATVIGNLTSPSIRIETINGIVVDLAKLDNILADNIKINNTLTVHAGKIDTLETNNLTVNNTLDAVIGDIDYLKTNTLTADQIKAEYATIENLTALKTYVYSFEATYGEFKDLTTERLEAAEGVIDKLETDYANIEFTNIGKAAIENLFTTSGLIENLVVGDGSITGELVGVTIKGDLIEGNTIVADKLVILGDDGLYYKLNTDGVTTAAEQTDYNSLNGSIITAKSITAAQISVSDLVAFDATIGGFTISDDAIYSDVKDSDGNTTRGIHLGSDGQLNIGDQSNFIKYYQDEDGNYRLAISAASILYALNGKQYSVADLGQLGEYVHVSTYEGEPCIELGEGDSDFKLIITNTRIIFMEGSSVPAYINNQSLNITKAVIEEEIQQGNFVWKVRANGNMGLMWKGAEE